jgi:hypothetical protein
MSHDKLLSSDPSQDRRFTRPSNDVVIPWEIEANSGHHQSAFPNDFPLLDANAIFAKAEPSNDPPFQAPSFYDIAGNLSKAEPLDSSAVALFDDIIDLTLGEQLSPKDEWMAITMEELTRSLDLGVSLRSDVFVTANQQSSLTVFPVSVPVCAWANLSESAIVPLSYPIS